MILITGAASRIGGLVCRQLQKSGVPFRAALHRTRGADFTPGETVAVDYLDPYSIRKALAGVDDVFFIAPGSPELPAMSRGFAKAADEAGVRRVIKISTYGGDGDALSELGSWHTEADDAFLGGRAAFTPLRCMPFMQNIFYIAEKMIKLRNVIMLPCGEARVSHIDARDIAEAVFAIMTARGPMAHSEYTLTGGAAVSYTEIAGMLTALTGTNIGYKDIPEEDARRMLITLGIPERLVEAKLSSFRLEKNDRRSFVSQDFRRLTGREPTSFRSFLSDHKDVFSGK